jgi:hypothetical protein
MPPSTRYQSVKRKPLATGSNPSLRIARSHSTLWRPWSPVITGGSEYERSLYKFPWLASEATYGPTYDDLEGGLSPMPEPPSCSDDSERLINTEADNRTSQELEDKSGSGDTEEEQCSESNLVRNFDFCSGGSLANLDDR